MKTQLPQKTINFLRYKRQYRRRTPAPVSKRPPADPLPFSVGARAVCVLRGIPEYLQQVVRMKYGNPGQWGHGRYPNATRKGPGRRRIPLAEQNKPAGNKLLRKFYEKLS